MKIIIWILHWRNSVFKLQLNTFLKYFKYLTLLFTFKIYLLVFLFCDMIINCPFSLQQTPKSIIILKQDVMVWYVLLPFLIDSHIKGTLHCGGKIFIMTQTLHFRGFCLNCLRYSSTIQQLQFTNDVHLWGNS